MQRWVPRSPPPLPTCSPTSLWSARCGGSAVRLTGHRTLEPPPPLWTSPDERAHHRRAGAGRRGRWLRRRLLLVGRAAPVGPVVLVGRSVRAVRSVRVVPVVLVAFLRDPPGCRDA